MHIQYIYVIFINMQNTMVVTNLWSMHHDTDLWGDPEVFRPERFLDTRGILKKKDITMPFGAGK